MGKEEKQTWLMSQGKGMKSHSVCHVGKEENKRWLMLRGKEIKKTVCHVGKVENKTGLMSSLLLKKNKTWLISRRYGIKKHSLCLLG